MKHIMWTRKKKAKAVCATKIDETDERKATMKTIQELYNEITANQELKARFIEAANAGKQEEFLKAHGCEATLQEVQTFLISKQDGDAPLSFDEMENAAGGACNKKTGVETAVSVIFVGVGCAIFAAASAVQGHNGQENDNEGRLCNLKNDK